MNVVKSIYAGLICLLTILIFQFSASSLSVSNGFVTSSSVRSNLVSKASRTMMDYKILSEDIAQIFKWLEYPNMTPVRFAALLQDSSCEYSPNCQLVVMSHGSMIALKSERYIADISISPKDIQPFSVDNIRIHFKEPHNRKFSLSKFKQFFSDGSPPSITPKFYPSCDSPCNGYRRYSVKMNDRFSGELKQKNRYVILDLSVDNRDRPVEINEVIIYS
jgi:hypothetical protein